ncbi:MAG: hypothetical protein Q8O19_07425 [Rectinemataceae bacterium]|nr:hypothetical protein [Rectinemataceae bacterium]
MHAKMTADKANSLLFVPIAIGLIYEILAAMGLLFTVFMILKTLLS